MSNEQYTPQEQAACEAAYDARYIGGARGSGFIMYRYGFVDGYRAAPASAVAVSGEELLNLPVEELLGRYWEIAYSEGKTGESHGTEAQQVLSSIRAAIAQAPKGTQDDRKAGPIWEAIQRACRELPEDCEIRFYMERDSGVLVWSDADGSDHMIDGEGYISDDINAAVDAALAAAGVTGKGE